MGGRNGHTEPCGDSEIDGGGSDGANHAEHEHGGVAIVHVDIDDLCADCIGDTGTHTDGTSEFEDGTKGHGLDVGHRPGGDGGGPAVGDIVGTCSDDTD